MRKYGYRMVDVTLRPVQPLVESVALAYVGPWKVKRVMLGLDTPGRKRTPTADFILTDRHAAPKTWTRWVLGRTKLTRAE